MLYVHFFYVLSFSELVYSPSPSYPSIIPITKSISFSLFGGCFPPTVPAVYSLSLLDGSDSSPSTTILLDTSQPLSYTSCQSISPSYLSLSLSTDPGPRLNNVVEARCCRKIRYHCFPNRNPADFLLRFLRPELRTTPQGLDRRDPAPSCPPRSPSSLCLYLSLPSSRSDPTSPLSRIVTLSHLFLAVPLIRSASWFFT